MRATFAEGRRLAATGRYDEALTVFRRLQESHPSVGALFNIADVEERIGRPIAAWSTYREAEKLARAKSDPRSREATDKAASLEAHLPRLIVEDPPPRLEITVGDPVAAAEWNQPLRRPTGTYELVARAPCRRPAAVRFRIEDGSAGDVVVPPLAFDAACARPLAPLPSPPPPAASGLRGLGWGAVGSGVVLAGVGGLFGVAALQTRADLDVACGGSADSCRSGNHAMTDDLNATGRAQATWSTVGLAAAGALLAAGVTILLATRAR